MENTKIDWCDSTWNPVTGCLHGCKYCYARRIAKRFSRNSKELIGVAKYCGIERNGVYEINEPWKYIGKVEPYPFGFAPTFHRYRLGDYKDKKGRNIFVCSMSDLFGEWVPDEWIKEVFDACREADQHNYLFLTKNPVRYVNLSMEDRLLLGENIWYGVTVTDVQQAWMAEEIMQDMDENAGAYLSIEPILEDISEDLKITIANFADWVIIGAETGERKDKVTPKKEWIRNIVRICRSCGVPVFMKSSLTEIWGGALIQQFPKRLQKEGGIRT